MDLTSDEILAEIRRLRQAEKKPIPLERWPERRLEQVMIPGTFAYFVEMAVITGTKDGNVRYMRFWVDREGRIPSREATQLVGQELGFKGLYKDWSVRVGAIDGKNRWALRVTQRMN